MKFIVVDAGVWVRMARSSFAKTLIDRFYYYYLFPVFNNYLLSEVHDALLKNKWATLPQADRFITLMKAICLFTIENTVYRLSPDPKDNYLLDLAIQHHCIFLVTDDTKLLRMPLKPVPVKSCNWFLKQFPV